MKYCSRCHKEKDESEFYKTQWIRGGLIEWCKQCRREYGAQYRDENRERIATKKREWVDRNRATIRRKNLEYYYKRKAEAQQNFSKC